MGGIKIIRDEPQIYDGATTTATEDQKKIFALIGRTVSNREQEVRGLLKDVGVDLPADASQQDLLTALFGTMRSNPGLCESFSKIAESEDPQFSAFWGEIAKAVDNIFQTSAGLASGAPSDSEMALMAIEAKEAEAKEKTKRTMIIVGSIVGVLVLTGVGFYGYKKGWFS